MEEIIIDGVDVIGCGYFCEADNECSICGMGTDGEDTFCKYCKDNSNCYYKQLKRLEQENKELKVENERMKEEIKEVKKYQYEQEYLKEEIEIRDNLSEKFRKEALSWANIANEYQKDKTKLEQTLQEIKELARGLINGSIGGCEDDIRYMLQEILTKAEEE